MYLNRGETSECHVTKCYLHVISSVLASLLSEALTAAHAVALMEVSVQESLPGTTLLLQKAEAHKSTDGNFQVSGNLNIP